MDNASCLNGLPNDDVLTIEDVRKHLKIGVNKAYSLFSSQVFPSYRIGTSHYIKRTSYEKWFSKLDNKEIEL